MRHIKDIREGDIIRIDGRVYEVKSIEKSPWMLKQHTEQYVLSLEYVLIDMGESLSNLAALRDRGKKE